MKKIQIWLLIAILAISCSRDGQEKADQPKRATGPVPVKTVFPQKENYENTLRLSATAYASREANLGSSLPGRVERMHFRVGDYVREGDLLVSMSGEMYTQALTEYQTLKKDFERLSRLMEKGSISVQDYDHVKAKYEASRSRMEMMKKSVEIRAPFSGTIVEYLVEEGENYFFNFNLEPGYSHTSGILRLMDLQSLDVVAEVNEKDLPGIQPGKKAFLSFPALPDTLIEGRVTKVDPFLSTLSHTAKVHIGLSSVGGQIKPGMFAEVKIL